MQTELVSLYRDVRFYCTLYWFRYQTSETVFKVVNLIILFKYFLVVYYDFMSHSESEPDFSNFTINLASDFDSTSESKSKLNLNVILVQCL